MDVAERLSPIGRLLKMRSIIRIGRHPWGHQTQSDLSPSHPSTLASRVVIKEQISTYNSILKFMTYMSVRTFASGPEQVQLERAPRGVTQRSRDNTHAVPFIRIEGSVRFVINPLPPVI